MQHRFQLTTPLGLADAERLSHALSALPGVRAVDAVPGSAEVRVQCDDGADLLGAIADAAARAGYEDARPARAGCCCGGCCGG